MLSKLRFLSRKFTHFHNLFFLHLEGAARNFDRNDVLISLFSPHCPSLTVTSWPLHLAFLSSEPLDIVRNIGLFPYLGLVMIAQYQGMAQSLKFSCKVDHFSQSKKKKKIFVSSPFSIVELNCHNCWLFITFFFW